ncbi:MAG: ankyrin repeat domain-containing protein [Ehrlichia sp.]
MRRFFYCVMNSDIPGLRSLINRLEESGISLSSILYRARTATLGDNILSYAVRYGKLDIVRFLLSVGANSNITNYKNETPLSIAKKNGRVDILNAILTVQ